LVTGALAIRFVVHRTNRGDDPRCATSPPDRD
jgi:hypothetical protein